MLPLGIYPDSRIILGTLAASYVNGLQTNGVAATIKHFVANDQEHERTSVDSVVSDRALREIYLYPYVVAKLFEMILWEISFTNGRFMLAQRDAKPFAYMTSYVFHQYLLFQFQPGRRYNRLGGIHCSEDPRLLKDILRREWGFNGLVMSDW